MKIDEVSTNIIKIALYIDKDYPGFVSELWIDESLQREIRNSIPSERDIQKFLEKTYLLISKVSDERRKKYLNGIFESLKFQVGALNDANMNFSKFSLNAYGYEIKRVKDSELEGIIVQITNLEDQLGKTRQEIYKKLSIKDDEILSLFEKEIKVAKELLPSYITQFTDEGFKLELVSNKPWSAFNSHIAPYKSKLSINTDVGLCRADLHHLSFHEAYGGHHSELSQKDKLLLEGRGEHGLVITFSPQTFISEAIAEGIYVIYNDQKENFEYQMVSKYDRLTFGLQNLATFLYFDDRKSRSEIDSILKIYPISEKTRKNILDFSTDKLFGRYAPIYYSALDFFMDTYQHSSNKDEYIKTLFTKPCTPNLVLNQLD